MQKESQAISLTIFITLQMSLRHFNTLVETPRKNKKENNIIEPFLKVLLFFYRKKKRKLTEATIGYRQLLDQTPTPAAPCLVTYAQWILHPTENLLHTLLALLTLAGLSLSCERSALALYFDNPFMWILLRSLYMCTEKRSQKAVGSRTSSRVTKKCGQSGKKNGNFPSY